MAIINGDIIILTGYIPIWATDVKDDSGNAEAAEDTSVTALGTTDTADSAPMLSGAAAVDTTPATSDAPADTNPSNPAKLNGGKLNDGNVDATVVAPT
jgi:hypothetical protein